MQNRVQKFGLGLISLIATIVVIALAWGFYQSRRSSNHDGENQKTLAKNRADRKRDAAEFLDLSEEAISAMRLKTVVAAPPKFSRILRLRGSLAIDSNRLSHVHARFPGQIVELATITGMQSMQERPQSPPSRGLQNFDVIEKGIAMAVIWSKDLGEKKSDLADCLARLQTDQITLEKYRKLAKDGANSNRELREQILKVDQELIAAFRAEETLKSYQVDEAEIQQVKAAVKKLHFRGNPDSSTEETDKSYSKEWARVVVTAPIGGVIVDKSVTVGEIVDANANLFKIADLSVLAVWLHIYEEDLPALAELPKPLTVSIKVPARPELGDLKGIMDRFSPMIDPNEHMALLIGTIQNPDRALLANQFITAEVGIPAEGGLTEIPTKSVIDFGNDAIVFVQPDPSKPRFQRRRVRIVQRYFDVVHVRSELTDEQKQQGLQEIHSGDAVVAGGILELEDYLSQ